MASYAKFQARNQTKASLLERITELQDEITKYKLELATAERDRIVGQAAKACRSRRSSAICSLRAACARSTGAMPSNHDGKRSCQLRHLRRSSSEL